MRLNVSAVKQVAQTHGLPVFQPENLKDPANQEHLRVAGADVIVVAAYGLILPRAVLDIPLQGCINIHASLLPRWRGAAPIQRAIEAGDAETGITIMRMEAGLDTGPILLTRQLPIATDDTSGSLLEKLSALGADSIVTALASLEQLSPMPQPTEGLTYARKIEKAEAWLDWKLPAAILDRRIRAFNPFPGALTSHQNAAVKVWQAMVVEGAGAPGTVLKITPDGIDVACGEGALRLLELQNPGGKRLSADDFARRSTISVGDRFDQARP
jgi:methionyl-tRNA formyltransferase